MKEYALVLSGGGAKGVYHIGAWKAIKELGLPVKAFFGNSIGAIIAAFLAQGIDNELDQLAADLDVNYILNLPSSLVSKGEIAIADDVDYPDVLSRIIKEGGIDTSPLRNNLNRYINEKELRNSGNAYGLITFNLSDMSAHELGIDEIEEGKLIDYLMASSALPGFKSIKINGKTFIDGAVHDNIPFNMAKKRGYKNIIIVDMSGIGFKKKMDFAGTNTAYIKNSIKMGGALEFDKKFLEDFMELGYLDTLKTFGRLEGIRYFIEPDEVFEKQITQLLKNTEISWPQSCRILLQHKNPLAAFIDAAASILDLPLITKWSYDTLLTAIKQEVAEIHHSLSSTSKSDIKHLEEHIKSFIRTWDLEKSPYYYYLLAKQMKSSIASKLLIRALEGFYPALECGDLFIQNIQAIYKTRYKQD